MAEAGQNLGGAWAGRLQKVGRQQGPLLSANSVQLGRCLAEAGQILGGAWAGQSWSDAGGLGEIWSDAGQMCLILARFPFLAKTGFFLELEPSVFEVFPSKTVLSLEFQPFLTLRFAKVTCAKPYCF